MRRINLPIVKTASILCSVSQVALYGKGVVVPLTWSVVGTTIKMAML